MKVRQSCDRLVVVHMINKILNRTFRDTIPRSGAKTPRLCLVLSTPVEIIVTLVVTYVFDEVPLLGSVARVGVSIPIRSSTPATFAPFIQGAF